LQQFKLLKDDHLSARCALLSKCMWLCQAE
jgi:hypothetical protein